MTAHTALLDGRPAAAEDLTPLAFAGYAHFTAVQVRGGGVRGVDLHLERLRVASLKMFGTSLPDETVRTRLREALADRLGPDGGGADLSLTATVYSPEGEFTASGHGAEPRLLIRTGAPSDGPSGPLALSVVEHERELPAVKHVGEVAKTYYLRQAVSQGFDDAAFADRRGRLSEASIWNLAFWDGEAVVWPEAAMLTGTTMGIVRRRLQTLGVPQRTQEIRLADLPGLKGAVVMNSWTPGVRVHRIGDTDIPAAPHFLKALHQAFESEPSTAP